MLRLSRFRDHLKSSLWFIPMVLLGAFVLMAGVMAYLDRNVTSSWLGWVAYGGSPVGARTILSTIATSMLSLTALVFSITLVVLQLAGSQLTPRVMQLFLQDRWSKIAMGVFMGTFAYALVALWFVRSAVEEVGGFVPVLMVTGAFGAVAASLLVFINYIHRIAQSIRVENVAEEIGGETLRVIHDTFPARAVARDANGDSDDVPGSDATLDIDRAADRRRVREVLMPKSGRIIALSAAPATKWASDQDAVVVFSVGCGMFLTEGAVLAHIVGGDEDEEFPLSDVVSIGRERAVDSDPAFGVRQLADIALRALSPGVNEPGTAVIVLDHIHEILQAIGEAELSDPSYWDDGGVVRTVVPRLTWDGWVALSLREIIDDGAESAQVCERLGNLLAALTERLPPGRRPVLLRYAEEVAMLPGSVRPYLEWTRSDPGTAL